MLCRNDQYDRRFAAGTIEMALHLGDELDGAVLAGEEGVIFGAKHVGARGILGAALADDDLADHDFLAVLKLAAAPFGNGIAS